MFVATFWATVNPEWQNDNYAQIGYRMFLRASEMPGFVALHKLALPVEHEFDELAIAYFDTEEHMTDWYNEGSHRAVEALGRREILGSYKIEILQMTRSYTMDSSTFVTDDAAERGADRLAKDPHAAL
jgi:heme-degrading monooxygenase HmoA